MNVFGDNGSIDSGKLVEYIAGQFPKDLAQMVKLRDEIAKRQGAMTAVEAANADRDAAAAELRKAREEAAGILAEAHADAASAKEKKRKQDGRETELVHREGQWESERRGAEQALALRESVVATNESRLTALEASLSEREAKLREDRDALDARIKAFQDKVAALSV